MVTDMAEKSILVVPMGVANIIFRVPFILCIIFRRPGEWQKIVIMIVAHARQRVTQI